MLETLRARFFENESLHPGLAWAEVEARILAAPGALEVLRRMEESGGEPDTIGYNDHRIAKTIEASIVFAAKRQVWQRMIC